MMHNSTKAKSTLPESMRKDRPISVPPPRTFTSGSPMNLFSTRRWLIAVLATLGMLTATGAYAQTDTTPPTVTSVGYYLDEAATIPITAVFLDTNLYIVIRFSENVENMPGITTGPFPDRTQGRPRIALLDGSASLSISIIAAGTAFTDLNACRAKSDSDTSEYLCRFFLNRFIVRSDRLYVELLAGGTSDLFNNALADDYLDPNGIAVLTTTPVMPSVTSDQSLFGRRPRHNNQRHSDRRCDLLGDSILRRVGYWHRIDGSAARHPPANLLPNRHGPGPAGAVWRSCHHWHAAKRNLRAP